MSNVAESPLFSEDPVKAPLRGQLQSDLKIIIADADPLIHDAAQLAPGNFCFNERSLQFLYASNHEIALLRENSDTALFILDMSPE